MGGEEQKFGEMANQEDLSNKLSDKQQFRQKDLNYLCKNSCRFLCTSTTESNQRYSNPAAENETRDEGQESVVKMRPSPKVKTGSHWKHKKPYVVLCHIYQGNRI